MRPRRRDDPGAENAAPMLEANPSGNGPEKPSGRLKRSARSRNMAAGPQEAAGSAGQAVDAEQAALGFTLQASDLEQQGPALLYPVVGIGASAGGLQAIEGLLATLDQGTGMSFVLVTHMAPDQKSFLSEIVLMDIDQLRRSRQHLMDARDLAKSTVESVPVPIIVLNSDCAIRSVNTAFRHLTGMNVNELEGRSLPELAKHLWGIESMRDKIESLARGPAGGALEFEHVSTTQQRKTLLIKVQALSTGGSRVYLLMLEDVTLRREAESLIARQKEALEGEVEVAAHRLTRTQGELRGLTGHLFTAQEEERQYVARELHDDISQRLSALKLVLDGMAADGRLKEDDYEQLLSARRQVEALNSDVRQISHRLHPSMLIDLGLSESLKAMVQEFGEREKMPASYLSQNLPVDVAQQVSTALYRITQEALRNISKHAGKTHVKVALSAMDGHLQLKVMDFGVGFDQEADGPSRGLGLVSMQERARLVGGDLKVESALGQGTTVTVEVPLDHA